MISYLIRRLLLIPPTLILITILVFCLTRIMPGGPIERVLQESAQSDHEGGKSGKGSTETLGEQELEELEELYSLDKPWIIAYGQWIGVLPKDCFITKKELKPAISATLGTPPAEQSFELVLRGTSRYVTVLIKENTIYSVLDRHGNSISRQGWFYKVESEENRKRRYRKRNLLDDDAETPGYYPRIIIYQKQFKGVLQGQLGNSIIYGDPVIHMIAQRIPVATHFGLLTALITYGISLPLGVLKALKHRTPLDTISSVFIFFGYSIPGFALGAILLVWFGARMELFPIFGLTSPDFITMSNSAKILDIIHHSILPLFCYSVGGFAYLTIMMKNNLMDHLSSDYVRTAMSKGMSFSSSIFKHAFRNALIPIATSLGQLITIFVSGSMLVERVFDIQGFGLLQYQAVISRDYPVVMGILTISSLLILLGNLLSDCIVATLDPRIKFL